MCSSASFSSWEPAAHGRHRYWSAFLSRHFTGQARHEKVAKFSLRLGTQRVSPFLGFSIRKCSVTFHQSHLSTA